MEKPPSPNEPDAMEHDLQEQLASIQNEEIPERLLELARQLQAHLRHRDKFPR